MVEPRNRTKKRVPRKTPGGAKTFLIKKEKHGVASCAICKNALQGTTTARAISKSVRKPTRLFGGNLCANCTSRVISLSALVEGKELRLADVDLRFRERVKQISGEKSS